MKRLTRRLRSRSASRVLTSGFDDGTIDQFDHAFPVLSAHSMHATFFVNTGPIVAGDPGHMTWADLHALFSAGNEVTGHTVDHADLKPLSVADAEHELRRPERAARPGLRSGILRLPVRIVRRHERGDRALLRLQQRARRGRDLQVRAVPPADAYATRTPRNPKKATKVSTLETFVLNAEADTQSTRLCPVRLPPCVRRRHGRPLRRVLDQPCPPERVPRFPRGRGQRRPRGGGDHRAGDRRPAQPTLPVARGRNRMHTTRPVTGPRDLGP
jgi:hypothetical protein